MYKMTNRRKIRQLRKMRFWRRRRADLSRPRLCVFRSTKHIQVQIIDDTKRIVLASASSVEAAFKNTPMRGKDMAAKIGTVIGERAEKAGVKAVVFDRNGYAYHGRIQALADAARSAGLQF